MTTDPKPIPDTEPHPVNELSDVVHHRARLGILTVLSQTETVTFQYLKSLLSLSDGNLSRHVDVLSEEGLVSVKKGYEGKRPRTWIAITPLGYAALNSEMTALRELVTQFERTSEPKQH
ncbi:MAG TPA: transcriptional regulator [Mycobacteriales bacterium]|jgi:DNA-binding HxlR family transcriptional regulator|nr:transcriptional regulator [Mycobacteriales bacterium]